MNIPPQVGHSQKIEYYTPQWIFEHLPIEFDLDPCAPVDESKRLVPAKKYYTLFDNGLIQPWEGTVFLNPPYYREDIPRWMYRLKKHGNGIAFVYARIDTAWFHANKPDGMFIPKGRVRFIEGNSMQEMQHSGGSPSIFLAYGEKCCEALSKCTLKGAYFESGNY